MGFSSKGMFERGLMGDLKGVHVVKIKPELGRCVAGSEGCRGRSATTQTVRWPPPWSGC